MLDLSFRLVVPCLLLSASAFGQSTPLALDQPGGGTLAADETDTFVVAAEAGQFIAGAAHQLTLDVVVTVRGPDGEMVETFDRPARGPEPFAFETGTSGGDYTIEVMGFEGDAGDYTIALQFLEPVATTGAGRVDQLMAGFSGPDTPGGVVLVVEGGEVLVEKAYGMANLVHDVPFQVTTPSNLGSTSKQFTSFAMLLLEKEGKLSLDDDVRKHIPELPDLGATVTIRHLMTHTSGYREFLNTLRMAGRRIDRGDFIDRAEVLDVVLRQSELQNEPNTEWNYNNTGYGLLTVILERVTGETFPDWMRANVFEPLGMNSTVVRADPSQLIPGSSQGYMPGPGGFMDARDLGGAIGAGGIYATAGDLGKWIRNLQTGELGGQEIVKRMMTPHRLKSGSSTGYGFGFFIDEQRGLARVHHGGSDSAHRAMLMTYPTIEAGVVVLSNHAGFISDRMASSIASVFFGDEMEAAEAAEASPVAEAPAARDAAADSAADSVAFDPATFPSIAGSYEMEAMPGFVLRFFEEDGVYLTQATGQGKIEIQPVGPMEFKLVGVEASVTFEADEDGSVNVAHLHQNGHFRATRLLEEPWTPSADEMEGYAGRYLSDELEAFYTVRVEDGALVMNQRRLGDMKLSAVKPGEFSVEGGSRVVFDLGDDDVATGFTLSEARTKGVVFLRK